MENKKVFIGNLDFSATDAELKSLLSKFGSVVSVHMKQKKGNAIIEMENADAAAQAVQQLEGTKHKDRQIRVSLFMKARRARSVSVRNYKERGANLTRKSAERPHVAKSPYLAEKPSHSGRPARDGYKPDSLRSSKPGSGSKPRERPAGLEARSFKSSSEERKGTARSPKKLWSSEKPSYSGRVDSDSRKPASLRSPKPQPRYKPTERTRASESRSFKSSTRERPATSGSQKKEWSAKKPPSRSVKTGDNRGERPERPEREKTFSSKPRDYSKPRSSTCPQNRAGKPSRPEAGGGRSVSGSANPKSRGNFAGRGKTPKRDR